MSVEIRDERFRAVVGDDVAFEELGKSFGFTEGPIWDRGNDRLVFSDIPGDTVHTWSARDGLGVLRKPSGETNGNCFDRKGGILSCEHGGSRVVRITLDGAVAEIVASHFAGKELNSPNDIVVRSDGAVFFTDPPYGRIGNNAKVKRGVPQAVMGVYRMDPDGSGPHLLLEDFERPNGLCLSVDERLLYVNDTAHRHIRVFDLAADGSLSGGRVFAETTGEREGVPDGMKVDAAGNVWCTGPGGIHVFDASGVCLGALHTPQKCANFAFGDDDLRTIYATCMTGLYRCRIATPGHPTD